MRGEKKAFQIHLIENINQKFIAVSPKHQPVAADAFVPSSFTTILVFWRALEMYTGSEPKAAHTIPDESKSTQELNIYRDCIVIRKIYCVHFE